MKILIACEKSGVVRDAFAALGHDAWSCDLEPSDTPGQHIKDDVLNYLSDGWDLMIAHPECKYICGSGLHWNSRRPGRVQKTREAIAFAEALWAAPIERIALENPIGCLATFSDLMKHTQIIQPYEFGENASKATCLWLKNLPDLVGTKYVQPRMANGKPRWGNMTDSGQNKLAPSEKRSADRAKTYQGIADAMAAQWGQVNQAKGS